MTAVVICPTPILQFFLNSGAPAAGGSVLTQVGGVNAATYSDSAGTILLPNPIPLNSRGEVSTSAGASAQLFLPANTVYTFTLSDASGNQIWVAPFVDGFQITQAQVAAALYPQTAAELAAAVTPVNFQYPPGHAYRYGTNTAPGTTDMTTALANSLLQAYQVGGSDPFWPAGTLVASQLTINQPVRIRTDGYATVIQQLFTSGLANTPIILIQASRVFIDPLSFIGNIATDTLEFNHCISINGATVSDITILGAFGTNIRGDVVNVAGTAVATVVNVKVGMVDGLNIYRNVFSCTGGDGIEIDAILGTQVGYRNFDMEPNSGSQFPTNIRVKYVRGATCQVAGGNLTGGIGSITVDRATLDNNLLANSTPAYPTHPTTAGNIGMITGNYQSLRIGSLIARNYQERLFVCIPTSSQRSLVTIDNVDIANCDNAEVTFNTLFLIDANTVLEIGGGLIVLAAIGRSIFNSSSASQFRLKNVKVSGGVIAANGVNCEFENITYDATGVTGNIFAAVNKSQFRNVVITNDGSATTQNLCNDNTFIECSLAPSVFTTGGSVWHTLIKTTLNGNLYHANSLELATSYNPGTITAGTIKQTVVTGVNGAVLGDFALASFLDVPTGYGTVTWQANVTNANNVTVTARNNGGADVTFGNNTLRVTVLKKFT